VSLASKLASVVPQNSNRSCGTCRWLGQLAPADRAAVDEWLAEGRSLAQLWRIASDDDTNPYPLSVAAFGGCFREHQRDRP
jgi:hypothetical protein